MAIPIIKTRDALNDPAVAAVRDCLRGGGLTGKGTEAVQVSQVVRGVIADVAARGDQAVIELTEKFDRVKLGEGNLRVSPADIAAAHQAAEPAFLEMVRRVIANIRQYQQSILVKAPPALNCAGRQIAVRYGPVQRVGVYVPGGRAFYPSTVLMTVVPAQVAGVKEIALVSPPQSGGNINPMVLALAGELGVTEVYRVGGSQAVAALAIGTATIRRVDKIVGPGNAFVAEAKRQLFGQVGIDSIAGPSEVLIVADDTARADWTAADMLAQAEHDPGSAILITPSTQLAQAVTQELEKQTKALSRGAAIAAALENYSAVIVVDDLDAACRLADQFAAEHLQIVVADEQAALAKIHNAGAIFLGPSTPVPLGDYYAGPSHVLPTGGTARFFSALSCNDFLKASSVLRYDAKALAADAADVIDFATREGLTAHAEAVRKRTKAE